VVAAARGSPGLTQELIFLDRDDDLASIKAKLESAGADQIFLAIPKRAAVLRTPLEFRILARMAHETSSETIIVTSDGERRRMAREEGFRTKRSLRAVRHLLRPSDRRGLWLPGLIPELPLPSLGAIFTIAVLLAVLAALNFYILPVMTVHLTPKTSTIQRELTLTIDPTAVEPDPEHGVVPGKTLDTTFQVSGSAVVEGTRTVGKDKAHGEVLFSNSGPALTLPAGTGVLAKNGARFVTDASVTLPAGARNVRAAITAADPGSGGNVNPGDIVGLDPSVPKTVSVTNQQPTSGGTDREGKVVSDGDVAKLRDQLLKKANDQALRQLQTLAGEGKTVPPQSIQTKVVNELFDPAVGQDADQVTGRLSVRATGTAFENKVFNDLVTQLLLGNVGDDVDIAGSGPRIGTPEVVGVEGQAVRLRVQASALAVQRIDPAAIAQLLSGKTVAQARAALQNVPGLDEPPTIELWPTWATRAYRVQVEVASPQ